MSSLQPPELDDRPFERLVTDAIDQVKERKHEWNDLSVDDPGVVLLEAFAYITEVMIYRLNRLPVKIYIEFLRLIGVKLHPPGAAYTYLVFRIPSPQATPIPIHPGTIVSAKSVGQEAKSIAFSTVQYATIPAGKTESPPVLAYHGTWVEGEPAGTGTGEPSSFVTVECSPIVGPTPELNHPHLLVGVEVDSSEGSSLRHIRFRREDDNNATPQEKIYRIWREVESFANLNPNREADQFVYMVDRVTGTITFAPKVNRQPETNGEATFLAKVPSPGKEIRLWYRSGGGLEGNVPANSLEICNAQFPEADDKNKGQVTVTNPEPARGGSDCESMQNAVDRGRLELRSLRRAVTPSDYEFLITQNFKGIRHAQAWAKAQRWKYVTPGTVEVLLEPEDEEDPDILTSVEKFLDRRKPLGTTCIVRWCPKEETPQHPINSLAEDSSHGDVFYAASGPHLFLTDNGGASWKKVWSAPPPPPPPEGETFHDREGEPSDGSESPPPGENVTHIQAHPYDPGRVVMTTTKQTNLEDVLSRLYFSHSCGEIWQCIPGAGSIIHDIEWIFRANHPLLLVATEDSLYSIEVPSPADHSPRLERIILEHSNPGCRAVTSIQDSDDHVYVAVAAKNQGRVFLSKQAGKSSTYSLIGELPAEISHLKFHRHHNQISLWAGVHLNNENYSGVYRWKLGPEPSWLPVDNWQGGDCTALSFAGDEILAGTESAGVLRCNLNLPKATWQLPTLDCNLPLDRELKSGGFSPVAIQAIASQTISGKQKVLVAFQDKTQIFRAQRSASQDEPNQQEEELIFHPNMDVSPSKTGPLTASNHAGEQP